MRWFNVDVKLNNNDIEWMHNIGDNITDPPWTIRPYKLSEEELHKISHIVDKIGVKPSYAAIIMVPANSVCKTHIDDKAKDAGLRQRITAINIPISVHEKSMFQYMKDMESEEVLETVDLQSSKCWRVDIPHRVDNSQSPHNRVVLSLSYYQTVEELHNMIISRSREVLV